MCTCEKCSKDMITRIARRGGRLFVGCTGYPKCRNTHSLPLPDEVKQLRDYNEQETTYIAEALKLAEEKAAKKAAGKKPAAKPAAAAEAEPSQSKVS